MSYLGSPPQFAQFPSKFFDGDGTAMTVTLDYAPPNLAALLVFISGVRQDTSAYTLSGTSLTFTGTVPSGTDNVQVVHLGQLAEIPTPGDDTVSTAKIQDDAVTADKLADSINTEIAANTAKVTNATHTGDVTGATALTIANDAVDIAMLSATGTASSSTFLRGDNAWAGGGKVLQVVNTVYSTSVTISTTSYATTGLSASITPASTSNKVLIVAFCQCELDSGSGAAGHYALEIHNGTSQLFETRATADNVGTANSKFPASSTVTYLDSPSTTSAITYTMRAKRGGTGIARFQTDSNAGTTADSSIVLMEISA